MDGGAAKGLDVFSAEGKATEDARRDDAIDAERSLVAAVLADEAGRDAALDRTADVVAPADFADPRSAALWTAALAVRKRGEPVDAGTVAEELSARREGAALKHLAEVLRLVVAPSACEHHARRVAEHAYARAFEAKLREAAAEMRGRGTPLERVTAARASLAAAPQGLRSQRDDSIRAGMTELMLDIEATALAAARGVVSSARWGVPELDGHFDDFGQWVEGTPGSPGECELIILGGLPATGKTTLATQAAEATARGTAASPGRRALYFTLEMPRKGLCRRLAAQRAGVSIQRIKRGILTPEELQDLGEAAVGLGELPIDFIEDCRSFEAIEARVMAERARGDVGLVVIDYLQLIDLSRATEDGARDDQRRVNGLKGLANAARVPIIAITSMTKTGQRAALDGKVDVTAGMGSGAEYAADAMGFLVRVNPKDDSLTPAVRVEWVKTRDGSPAPTLLSCDLLRGRFSSLRSEANDAP